jgi:tetratricopeptide (TPR) repeat protein
VIRQSEVQTLIEQAHACQRQRQWDQARALLEQALRAEPKNPLTLTKLGELALRQKDHWRAHKLLWSALRVEPHIAPAWTELAHALWLLGRRVAAVRAAQRAVEIQPYAVGARLRFIQFAAWTGAIQEARSALEPLLDWATQPPEVQAIGIGVQGEICIAEGRFAEATGYLAEAVRRAPGNMAARIILSMNRLRLGDFAAGWADLGIREEGAELYPGGPPARLGRWWAGEDLAGKSILVADDQGHGDAIQFFRYLPLLKQRGPARITWRTFPPLVRLFAETAPAVTVVAALPDDAAFDVHCTSTSLPLWFDTTAQNVPAPIPYLRAPSHARIQLPPPAAAPKVGLVWSGDSRHMRDHLRSIPASTFLTLADVPGLQVHSLQHDVRGYDRPALNARPHIRREIEKAVDLADTARLIDGLDLVIAVDTAVAHLAGAMGKPVWLLLHSTPDWRWQIDREDCPWYPSFRLFRLAPPEWLERRHPRQSSRLTEDAQLVPDDMGWRPLVRRVLDELRAYSRTKPARSRRRDHSAERPPAE